MPFIVHVCNGCDCILERGDDPSEHGAEDERCEGEGGVERIEVFTEREVGRRLAQALAALGDDSLEARLGAYLLEHGGEPGGIGLSLHLKSDSASAMSVFGEEEEGSPMAGGTGIGIGDTVRDAVAMLLKEARR